MARIAPLEAHRSSRHGIARYLVPFVPGVVVAGVITTLVASVLLWGREEASAEEALRRRQQIVVDAVDKSISEATIRLVALSGLYQASEEVTDVEFLRFSTNLGLSPGMEAIAYMPLVVGRNLDPYQERMRAEIPGFTVYRIDETGERVPVSPGRVHVPVERYHPENAFTGVHGFDSMSEANRAATLELARVTRDATITPLVTLVTSDDNDGFLLYWPITDPEKAALTGYAAAVMDLSDLVDAAVSPLMDQFASWEVTDRTGEAALPGHGILTVGGRTWQIDVTPAPDSDMVPDPTYPLLLLGLGLLATAVTASALSVWVRQREAEADFERLRELTRAKDQFLASVGHELRTPLTSVLGFAEILRSDKEGLGDDERRHMIAAVAEEATDLAAIVDDLLVAARSELNLLVVQRVPVSARAQVAQVLEMSHRAGSQMVEVEADEGEPYRAAGDPGRVRQILRNLVTNAGRYGGDRVVIRLGYGDDTVSIEVRDNGPGVPAQDAERIFDPYYRAHAAGSQPAALGIGLAVARQLARLMGGDLVYRREEEWTVFELVLPRAEVAVAADPAFSTATPA